MIALQHKIQFTLVKGIGYNYNPRPYDASFREGVIRWSTQFSWLFFFILSTALDDRSLVTIFLTPPISFAYLIDL